MKEYTDKEIVEDLRNGGNNVSQYVYSKFMPMLEFLVRKINGGLTYEDARDTLSNGLLIMLEHLNDKDFMLTCKFSTYFYSVCQNQLRSILEKRRAFINYCNNQEEAEPDIDFTEQIDQKLYYDIFGEALKSIDPIGREIFDLFLQGLSMKEIAHKLGYTSGYIRKKKCLTTRKLIENVKKNPCYEAIKREEHFMKNAI